MKKTLPIQSTFHWLRAHPIIGAAIAVGLIVLVTLAGLGGGKTDQTTSYFEVSRGNLLISVVEGGSLEAVTETSVRNMVEGTGRIIRIAPEGSYVKKNDLLVELDSSSAQDQVSQQQITVRRAELERLQAEKELEIASSQTNSDFTAANIQLELARIDLQKYQEGELAQMLRQFEIEVDTTQEQILVDEERYRYSTNLLAAGFETKSTADGHRLTWLRTQKNLQQATNNLWMFLQFDRRKLVTQYNSRVEEAEKELSRVVKQSEAKMAQYQADLETKKRTLDLNQTKLARDEQNLRAARILAPTDGLVVYAMPEGRFSSESMIEEGATVRYRQEIIKLPDTSAMKLTVKVHEAHVGKVKPGQTAYIVLDPQPDHRYLGTVTKVAVMPNNQDRWSNPNLTVYNTEIMITEQLPESVKPRISARAEIVVTNLTDVVSVPLQAVTTLRGKPVVYLAGASPKPVSVEVGMYNTRFIHVVTGLKDGDRVLLSPPIDTEGADIDGKIMQEGDEVPTNQVSVAQLPFPNPDDAGMLERPARNRPAGESTGDPSAAREGNSPSSNQAQAEPGAGGRGGGFNREAMLKQWDTDGDGQLSDEERAAMGEAFNRTRNRPGQGAGGGSQRTRPPADGGDN